MKCPIDDAELVMSERQGVEIDYCPTCRGVWLDRGELDKILDRAASMAGLSAAGPPPAQPATPGVPPAAPAAPAPPPTTPGPPTAYQDRSYPAPSPAYRDDRYRDDRYRDDRGRDGYRDQDGGPYRRKKKESWLSDILDFG